MVGTRIAPGKRNISFSGTVSAGISILVSALFPEVLFILTVIVPVATAVACNSTYTQLDLLGAGIVREEPATTVGLWGEVVADVKL